MTAKDITTYRKPAGWPGPNAAPKRSHLDPRDVLRDETITPEAKRALLADWASDARAVEHLPGFRQLDNGALVRLDDIACALKELDSKGSGLDHAGDMLIRSRRRRVRMADILRLRRRDRRDDDDDDDPPPSPAFVLPRPGGGGGLAPVAAIASAPVPEAA
jgi:hypothetical protein